MYFVAICFIIIQIGACDKLKRCDDEQNTPHCLADIKTKKYKTKNSKHSNGDEKRLQQINSYEKVYKQKYEKYAAKRDKIESNSEVRRDSAGKNQSAPTKDCNKRKYQLNCNKSWQKSKTGDGSTKNGKVYIKRENNPLLNLDEDGNDVKNKKGGNRERSFNTAYSKAKEKPKNNWKAK